MTCRASCGRSECRFGCPLLAAVRILWLIDDDCGNCRANSTLAATDITRSANGALLLAILDSTAQFVLVCVVLRRAPVQFDRNALYFGPHSLVCEFRYRNTAFSISFQY